MKNKGISFIIKEIDSDKDFSIFKRIKSSLGLNDILGTYFYDNKNIEIYLKEHLDLIEDHSEQWKQRKLLRYICSIVSHEGVHKAIDNININLDIKQEHFAINRMCL